MAELATSDDPGYMRDMDAFLRMAKYPLVAASDCSTDMKSEAVDVCVAACERHAADLEKCTQTIKDTLDKRFGGPWHVVVGKAFSFEVTHECKHFLHLFVAGTTGVLAWKL